MKDAKYLLAYLLPLSAIIALVRLGAWCWSTVAFAFVVLPLLEQVLPKSTDNVPPEVEDARSHRRLFDWLLYLNAPLLFGIVGYYIYLSAVYPFTIIEWVGLTLTVGIVVGVNGINVAHELGHRTNLQEQALAKWMLLPALYQHFFVEHNRGHHKNIATDADPASAHLGEPLYVFWVRSIVDGWFSAWQLEAKRLKKMGLPLWSWYNEMVRFQVYQALWLIGIAACSGYKGFLAAIAVAVVGFLLLETVNYIEHYGLRRNILPSGRPEPVSPAHSWNSNHELGRIMLYELTRHSDHHYKATRKYQILRHIDTSPQMPLGYPASILLALMPPLWFRIVNPLVPHATILGN